MFSVLFESCKLGTTRQCFSILFSYRNGKFFFFGIFSRKKRFFFEVQYLKSCPIIFQQAHSENQSIASDQHPQQHVSAEIHVQVHEDNEEESRNLNFDEDTASMPELEDHIPEVMVTSRSPGSDDSK